MKNIRRMVNICTEEKDENSLQKIFELISKKDKEEKEENWVTEVTEFIEEKTKHEEILFFYDQIIFFFTEKNIREKKNLNIHFFNQILEKVIKNNDRKLFTNILREIKKRGIIFNSKTYLLILSVYEMNNDHLNKSLNLVREMQKLNIDIDEQIHVSLMKIFGNNNKHKEAIGTKKIIF